MDGRKPSAGAKTFYGSTALTNRPGAIATYMESFLRDLGEARDACNKLPFVDDSLRYKIATELDRIEAALPLERMSVTKPLIKGWAPLVSRQKDPSIKTRRLSGCTRRHAARRRLPPRSGAKPRRCVPE